MGYSMGSHHRTGMTPAVLNDSPMDMGYGYGNFGLGSSGMALGPFSSSAGLTGGIGGLAGGSAMMASDEFSNLFLSPRATPHVGKARPRSSSEDYEGNAHSMHIHYNHDYQPHHSQQMNQSAVDHHDDMHERYYTTGMKLHSPFCVSIREFVIALMAVRMLTHSRWPSVS